MVDFTAGDVGKETGKCADRPKKQEDLDTGRYRECYSVSIGGHCRCSI